MSPLLIVLFSLIGGFLYALRGGNWFREGKSTLVNRLIFCLPFTALVHITYGLPFISLGFLVSLIVVISLGHGLFMDCGRWDLDDDSKEHEFPITYIIGAEDYSWSFQKQRNFDILGMSLLGLLRHACIIAPLYATIDTTHMVFYTLLGLMHGPLYQIGHLIGEKGILKVFPANKHTSYGEIFVGILIIGGWCIFGTGQ